MRLIIFLWQHEHDGVQLPTDFCRQISLLLPAKFIVSAATTSHDLNRMTGVIWCDLDMETDMLDQF
jgi:hypothetical protein